MERRACVVAVELHPQLPGRGIEILDPHRGVHKAVCHLTEKRCVFLVHVPELRRFDSNGKASLGRVAWVAARTLLREQGVGRPGMELAVGLRGVIAYDRVLTGKYVSGVTDDELPGVNSVEGFGCERGLYSWFAGDAASTNSARILKVPKD